MRKNVIRICFFAAVIALIGLTNTASATLLGSGSTTIGTETGSFTSTPTTIGPVAFSIGGGADTGFITETVGNFSGNPFGGVTFEWTVQVTKGIIQTLSTTDYTGFSVDAGVISSPVTVQGSVNSGVVNLNYISVLAAGQTATVVLNTNSVNDTFGTVQLIDGGVYAGAPNTWLAPLVGGPNVSSPEPASLTLCVLGLVTAGGVGAWRRRTRREV